VAHVPGWVVERRGEDTVLWPTAGAPTAQRLEGRYDSAAIDAEGRLWLAAARPTPTLWRAGASWTPEVEVEPQFLDLRRVGERVSVVATVAGGAVLLESMDGGRRLSETLRASVSLHGPVGYEGARLALADGVVFSDYGDGFASGPERRWTCLLEVDGAVFACVERGLGRITGSVESVATETVFDVRDIRGPDEGCPPPGELRDVCERQWLHFGGESGLVRFDAGAGPGAPAEEAGACECRGAGSAAGAEWLVLFALGRRRRGPPRGRARVSLPVPRWRRRRPRRWGGPPRRTSRSAGLGTSRLTGFDRRGTRTTTGSWRFAWRARRPSSCAPLRRVRRSRRR